MRKLFYSFEGEKARTTLDRVDRPEHFVNGLSGSMFALFLDHKKIFLDSGKMFPRFFYEQLKSFVVSVLHFRSMQGSGRVVSARKLVQFSLECIPHGFPDGIHEERNC